MGNNKYFLDTCTGGSPLYNSGSQVLDKLFSVKRLFKDSTIGQLFV
jgi:hypothetical protein